MELDSRRNHEDVGRGVHAVDSATNSGVARTVARGPHIGELSPANRRFGPQPSNPRAEVRLLPGPFRPAWSVEGGSVDELLDVTVERPVLEQLQVEVGRTLEDRVQPGLTGDDREEGDLYAVD